MPKFLVCEHCQTLVEVIRDGGVPLICCGRPMIELIPNTTEVLAEKHLPYVRMEDGNVLIQAGIVPHPMLPEHHIEWMLLELENGIFRKHLQVCATPELLFQIGDAMPVAAYAYCNVHGFFKTDLFPLR